MSRMITKITVTVVSKPGIITEKSEYKTERYPVLAENEHLYCIDDEFYSTVAKSKTYELSRGRVEKPSIHFSTNDSCWGTSFRYYLWTFKKKKAETIRKEIKEEIEKRYGNLFNINLDFIK